MLIDDNLVSIDHKDLSAAITGEAIPLNMLLKPGRQEPVCVFVRVDEPACGGTSLILAIEQADEKTGDFSVACKMTVAQADLLPGNPLGWRWLPPQVTKPWIRFKSMPQGTFTSGKLFAAVVREDPLEYEDGMYIDKGELKC